jgi:hypothetical protein
MSKIAGGNPWLFVENADLKLITGIDSELRFFQYSIKFPKTGQEKLLIYDYQCLGALVLVRLKAVSESVNGRNKANPKELEESYWHEPADWALKLQILLAHPEELSAKRVKNYVEIIMYDYKLKLAPLIATVGSENLKQVLDGCRLGVTMLDFNNSADMTPEMKAMDERLLKHGSCFLELEYRVRSVRQMEYFLSGDACYPFQNGRHN